MKTRCLLMALVAVVVGACSSIDCPVQSLVMVKYDVVSSGAGVKLQDTLSVMSEKNDGSDVVLLNKTTGVSTFSLPISYQHEEDVLVFSLTDTLHRQIQDTVWMQKRDIQRFESVDCNAAFFHEITGLRSTHHGIDTIVIKNSSVTYDDRITHLEISFKARQ